MLHSALMQGQVFHRRLKPRPHAFDYPIFMSLLDVSKIDDIVSRSRLWSKHRFNLVSYYRGDYIRGGATITEAVQQQILAQTGERFEGRIMMLTHLRYLGFCFNPVSFYFCFQENQSEPKYIVAEINNTPWNERHCYVLTNKSASTQAEFVFDKTFHVSPFMPMDMEYRWRFDLEDPIKIHMALYRKNELCFEAGLDLSAMPFNARNMRRVPLRYPAMTLAVVMRIYWQALRLWLKRVPFYSNPKHLFQESNYEHHS